MKDARSVSPLAEVNPESVADAPGAPARTVGFHEAPILWTDLNGQDSPSWSLGRISNLFCLPLCIAQENACNEQAGTTPQFGHEQ